MFFFPDRRRVVKTCLADDNHVEDRVEACPSGAHRSLTLLVLRRIIKQPFNVIVSLALQGVIVLLS